MSNIKNNLGADPKIQQWLNEGYARCNQQAFLKDDPIGIVHRFSGLQDIEIIGFWTSMLAWGQRKTIINSAEN